MYIDTWATDYGTVKVSPREATILVMGTHKAYASGRIGALAREIDAACVKVAKWRHDRA